MFHFTFNMVLRRTWRHNRTKSQSSGEKPWGDSAGGGSSTMYDSRSQKPRGSAALPGTCICITKATPHMFADTIVDACMPHLALDL